MKSIFQQNQFKSDLKRIAGSGRYKLPELLAVVDALAHSQELATKLRDHALTGNWLGFRECHIKPDWLLIYKVEPERIVLVRTGSHSDLF